MVNLTKMYTINYDATLDVTDNYYATKICDKHKSEKQSKHTRISFDIF